MPPGGAGRSGVTSALLDRVARAAGIRSNWHDIYGKEHTVPDATKQALLADMGFAAGSNAEARESLGRLADWESRRFLPPTLSGHEGETIALRIAAERQPLAGRADFGARGRQHGAAPARSRQPRLRQRRRAWTGGAWRRRLPGCPRKLAGATASSTKAPPNWPAISRSRRADAILPERPAGSPRLSGIATQLYALRRKGDQGAGDFTTLGEFAEMAANAGAATVGLNPLHALFSQDREHASPYYPSDRRFLDPLYIDAGMLDGPRAKAALARNADQIAALSALPDVDYPNVWALKRAILEAGFADFNHICERPIGYATRRAFEDFLERGGASLERFACFEAISEIRKRETWPSWPGPLRDGEPGALAAFMQKNAALVRFHLYLQWLADRQFREAAKRGRTGGSWLGFYRDLAVGAAPDGAEVWANADQFLAGTSVGAPPDPFAEGGQNWGLRAPNPLAWRRSNYQLFREVLAANMAGAGALRIDHAMGLTRLFVIPQGADADEGAYLAFPERDLFAELALESQRAACVIVGEDLGTVPWDFRATMDAANILSYRVMWFERDGAEFSPAESYPPKSVACVTTHDLPTIAGWWQGEDIREKQALGLIPREVAEAARKERAASKLAFLRAIGIETGPDYMPPLASVVAAAHEFIGRTPSLIAIAQLDDLVGEFTGVNLPGTDRERAKLAA